MSAITDAQERITHVLSSYIESFRRKLFGMNNERLDFLMDSFYKLNPQQRHAALGGGIAVIVGFVMFSVFIYFSQVNSLERELNDSFSALREVKLLLAEDKIQDKKFENLVENIKRKTKNVNFKPFFEKLSREKNVELKGLSERPLDMDSNNPLSQRVKEVQVDMKLPKVSIPRLFNFLVEVEKSGHYMRIQDLKITGTYGNKLFFEAGLLVRGYSTSK